MHDVAMIEQLIESGQITQVLMRGSREKDTIVVLQQTLHELGFDGPLRWDTYGADGDYGGCTSRAVRAFARQGGIDADGSAVTLEIGRALVKSVNEALDAQEHKPTQDAANMVALGENVLERGAKGAEVVELQIRLSGFRGTVWDGHFGAGTELQIQAFQRDYMKIPEPTGQADLGTYQALHQFAQDYPIDFSKLRCACGDCEGFGQNLSANVYREGKPKIEAYHHKEYPGIHKAILHAFRAALFYREFTEEAPPFITCGYRCWINNERKGRTSTNHMGKAIDCDFPLQPGDDKRDDQIRCDRFRSVLVEKSNFQLEWAAPNRKALEPSRIAPTWIHMDVRQYSPRYLDDRFFVKSAEELDTFALSPTSS